MTKQEWSGLIACADDQQRMAALLYVAEQLEWVALSEPDARAMLEEMSLKLRQPATL